MKKLIVDFKPETSTIDDLFIKYNELKDFYISTNHALTAYDKQQYKDLLDKLEIELYELKEKIQPRKKFSFSKKKHENHKEIINPEPNPFIQKENAQPIDFISQIEGIENAKNETFLLNQNQVKKSWKIMNNKNCEIRINAFFDCLFVKNNRNCKIFIGPVKSSVFLDNNEDCEIAIMSHQVNTKSFL